MVYFPMRGDGHELHVPLETLRENKEDPWKSKPRIEQQFTNRGLAILICV